MNVSTPVSKRLAPSWTLCRLARRGQEIANLEGGYKSLEKEVESLKGRLDKRDEAITELCGAVEFLTNKRYRCNDDKVSPCN